MGNLIGLGVIALIMLVPIGLMIAVGVVVYKDAKAHHLSAGLWTTVAIIAPNFIGVIIYLVVRSNQEKLYTCSNCNTEVKEDYNICPSCKSVFEKICHVCKHAIKNDVAYCPYCGTEVDQQEHMQTATKVSKKTNIAKPLAIIGGILFAFILLVFGGMLTMALASGDLDGALKSSTSVSVMSIETSMGEHLKSSFWYQSGKDSINLRRESGEAINLVGTVLVEKGTINMDVLGPDGEVLYTEMYEPMSGEQEVNIELGASQTGEYKVLMQMKEAAGSYDIRGN